MKKGLSDIVTSILFILIILIAIGIIWAFVRPTVEETSQVESASSCLVVKLDAAQCEYSGNESDAHVSLIINRGADAVELKDVRFVFADASGKSTLIRDWSQRSVGKALPENYENAAAGFSLGSFIPAKVVVAGIINDGTVCAPINEYTCTRYQYIPGTGCADFNGDQGINAFDYDDYIDCFIRTLRGEVCPGGRSPDQTGDGGTNIDDYNTFVEAFISEDKGGC